jgi:hypothetical protein
MKLDPERNQNRRGCLWIFFWRAMNGSFVWGESRQKNFSIVCRYSRFSYIMLTIRNNNNNKCVVELFLCFFFISFHSHINCPQLGWRIKINRLLSDNHLHLSINVAPDSIWRWRRAKGHPIIDFHQTLSRKIGENQGDNGQTRVDRSRRRVLAIRPSPRRTVRVSPSLSPPPPPSSAHDEREKG